MTEFVRQQNRQQRKSKGDTRGEARWMLVEEFECAHPFVDGGSFVLGEGGGKLCACSQRGAQREEKEDASDDQASARWSIGRWRLGWTLQVDAPCRFRLRE